MLKCTNNKGSKNIANGLYLTLREDYVLEINKCLRLIQHTIIYVTRFLEDEEFL